MGFDRDLRDIAVIGPSGGTRSAPIVVEIAANAIRLAVGKIHEGPEEVGKIGLQPRVDKKPRQGFDYGFERQCSRVGGG